MSCSTFPTGERVDAIVRRRRTGGAPIDAKFPLDNFERVVSAESDAERQLHEKAFARDVKGHIDAIAAKYFRPDFGTFDFAFMYLPAEAIHYEVVAGKSARCSRTRTSAAYSRSRPQPSARTCR